MTRVYYGVAIEHYPGCYRAMLANPQYFLQVRRKGREWLSEIRNSKTGQLICYRGIHRSLRDAIDSVRHLLPVEAGGGGQEYL